MRQIQSADNPHYRALKKLCQSSRERKKTGLAVLDGMHLIEAYTDKFGAVAELVVSESGSQKPEIAAWLAGQGGAVRQTVLTDRLLVELGLVDTPSGILALAVQPQTGHGPDVGSDCVVLDGVQDPGNLGSILRSAAAAGFTQVLLSPDCAQAWAPKTLRAGQGGHFLVDIHEAQDLPVFLATYRGTVAVTALGAGRESCSLFDADLAAPVAWVFGSEGQGVRAEVLAQAGLRVQIPMPGGVESLNVAAAAAVCLFETVRQRSGGK